MHTASFADSVFLLLRSSAYDAQNICLIVKRLVYYFSILMFCGGSQGSQEQVMTSSLKA